MSDASLTWLVLAVAALLAWLFGSAYWRRYAKGRVTVYEHEAGLKYAEGKLVDVLGPGRYGTWPAAVDITRLDLREQSASVPGQEILTSDQMPVRVSVVAVYRISDPRAYAKNAMVPISQLYQLVQTAMREAVARQSLDALLADRDVVVRGMQEALAPSVAPLGFTLSSIKLLDLTLVGAAKQAYADLWRAQKEGLAALERARGEQASLRALANAARMLKDNPELMNLRVLQTLAGAPGKTPPTIVLGGAGGIVPVSRNGAAEEAPAES